MTVAAAGGGFEDPSEDVLAQAAAAFGLLASPARLHIVWALAQGESDVTGLAERVGGALPAVSQHLTKLKLAGLVRSRRAARQPVRTGSDRWPCEMNESTGGRPSAGAARVRPGNRSKRAGRATRASSRPSGAPRQWWMPYPKAR